MLQLSQLANIQDDPGACRRLFLERARLEARQRYEQQFKRGWLRRLWAALTGRDYLLRRLDDLPGPTFALARRLPDVQNVPLARIVGSESRAHDFDRDFAPLHPHSRERWVSVATLWAEGRTLPPVDLVQVGEEYYVLDGHHRVSVALAFGESEIAAWVVAAPAPSAAAPCCAPALPA